MKILHCPKTVGGNVQGLVSAEREIGLDSRSLSFVQPKYGYKVDDILFKSGQNFISKEFVRWATILGDLPNYDVVHFNFGTLLSPEILPVGEQFPTSLARRLYNSLYAGWTHGMDLKLLNWQNKVVAVTYQGDDARQGDYCREHYSIHFAHEVEDSYYTNASDRKKRESIRMVDEYSDLIYSVNPDLLHVLPSRASFIPYASVDPRQWTPCFLPESPSVPHIVHAPTHRAVKGTRYILEAFERLKSEGLDFTYTLIEGVDQSEAKKVYKTADLLVDQLLAGYYGGLAVELMALGKPVICYLREEDMGLLPDGMYEEMPVICAGPDTIYDVLKSWLTEEKDRLAEKGRQSRAYAEKWHDPIRIASRLKQDYERVHQRKSKVGNLDMGKHP